MMIAIFTLGANEFHIDKMADFIDDRWGNGSKYTDQDVLMRDVKSGRIRMVLVYDVEALDEAAQSELKRLGIGVFSYKDLDKLDKLWMKELTRREEEQKKVEKKKEELKDIQTINL
jgi:hypothetical protein